jgi:hypothetical protein
MIYDLQGRRHVKLSKGIYIRDGKKVVNKWAQNLSSKENLPYKENKNKRKDFTQSSLHGSLF